MNSERQSRELRACAWVWILCVVQGTRSLCPWSFSSHAIILVLWSLVSSSLKPLELFWRLMKTLVLVRVFNTGYPVFDSFEDCGAIWMWGLVGGSRLRRWALKIVPGSGLPCLPPGLDHANSCGLSWSCSHQHAFLLQQEKLWNCEPA